MGREKVFLAHVKRDEDGVRTEQSCQAHCNAAAEYAGEALSGIGLSKTAFLAGALHDCGKFTEDYQTYLEKAANGEEVRRGSVNHTFAGVRYILEKFHANNLNRMGLLASEIIAYAIGAHHGLFDCVNDDHENGFRHRMTKEGISYKVAVSNYFENCMSEEEIANLFEKSAIEVREAYGKIIGLIPESEWKGENSKEAGQEVFFQIGMLARLVLSAVVEGDRRDTAEFFAGRLRDIQRASGELWEKSLCEVEKRLDLLKTDTDIAKARRQFSILCKESAGNEPGIYRLDMPTGSGKTLSSLRYALAHAKEWNKKRIIFVTPLLSILDQNAAVIREFIHNDSIVLEHHSNIVKPQEGTEEFDLWECCTEAWRAPIIITTMVQFLDTLFSGKMGAVRRMHALCESVVIIDEVQTVPAKMLSLFNTALGFLQSVCKATIILSSATQPCFEKTHYPLRNVKGEIVSCSDDIRMLFERTNICKSDSCTLEESATLIEGILEGSKSLLVVCNKKGEAQYLFNQMKSCGAEVYHLSASMCIQHRKDVLERIKQALDEVDVTGNKVVCISTQVIEAGVDISFEKAIRFTAGMDSVIQTAGRCNRSREAGPGKKGDVYILTCLDENLNRLEEIKKARMATESLLAEFDKESSSFRDSLESREATDFYYKMFYNSFAEGYQDYTLESGGTIYDLLSQNKNNVGISEEKHQFYLVQAFSKAGHEFTVFDTDGIDVIVPYEQGKELIEELNSPKAVWDIGFVKQVLENAKQYTVSLYSYQVKKLEEIGALYWIHEGRTAVLNQTCYNEETGVVEEYDNNGYLGVG